MERPVCKAFEYAVEFVRGNGIPDGVKIQSHSYNIFNPANSACNGCPLGTTYMELLKASGADKGISMESVWTRHMDSINSAVRGSTARGVMDLWHYKLDAAGFKKDVYDHATDPKHVGNILKRNNGYACRNFVTDEIVKDIATIAIPQQFRWSDDMPDVLDLVYKRVTEGSARPHDGLIKTFAERTGWQDIDKFLERYGRRTTSS